ncbi:MULTISPECIES: tyrosine recombinase XerC [unclassified Microbacterium]|uniref:site-specific integrase n=1 Tax=unclassified Microbacterium TaxID=2609290 RepID=UPI00386EBA8A
MIYRRCSCRRPDTRSPYGTLPEKPTERQVDNACPRLLSDPKHGKWGYYLSRGFDASGRRLQTRVANFDSRRAAQSALAKARAEHDRGEFVETSRVKFGQWLDEWLDGREQRGDIKRSTLDNYRRYVAADIKPTALGRLRLTDIKRADVRRFIDALIADGRGATTVRRIVAVVQGALTAAMRDDIIATNPARGVRLPVVEAHEFEPWSPAQVGAFLDRAARHRVGALFEIAVLTGLRRAELLGLRWGDVDLARRELTVRTTRVQTLSAVVENSPKTSAGRRVVQLDDAAVGAFVAWQIVQDADRLNCGTLWEGDGHVFTYENGTPLRPQYVTRLFETLRSEIGLPDMTLHGLRHMHASLLLASGTDIALVSKRLGHSSISITSDIYTHLIGDAGRRAAESASALIPRASAQQVHNEPAGAGITKAPEPARTA